MKPSWGRISNDGVAVCASAADHVGTMAGTVHQAAELLGVCQQAGWDDPTVPVGEPVAGMRIGVLGGDFVSDCDPGVRRVFNASQETLRSLGTELVGLELDVDLAEADSHLNTLCRDLLVAYGDDLRAAPPGMLGSELRTWLELFAHADDDAYNNALAQRERLQEVLAQLVRQVDVVVCPTARSSAGPYADATDEPREARIGNCSLWSFTGVPSLTLPAGVDGSGMPVGLLISGPPRADSMVLLSLIHI